VRRFVLGDLTSVKPGVELPERHVDLRQRYRGQDSTDCRPEGLPKKNMRAVVQRVTRAEVRVGGSAVGRVRSGLVVLVGIAKEDTDASGQFLAEKIVHLRIFNDDEGRMNRSLLEMRAGLAAGKDVDAGPGILCVSQFTLYGDCRKGRRPSYDRAAPPEAARPLYQKFVEQLRSFGVPVQTGEFQAMMEVALVNDGPVTVLLDSEKVF
jgi:D-aminoacyl-tRNA deacylase